MMRLSLSILIYAILLSGCTSNEKSRWYLLPQHDRVGSSNNGMRLFNSLPSASITLEGSAYDMCKSVNLWIHKNSEDDTTLRIDTSLVKEFHPSPESCLDRLREKKEAVYFNDVSIDELRWYIAGKFNLVATPVDGGYIMYPRELANLYENLNRKIPLTDDQWPLEENFEDKDATVAEIVAMMNFILPSDEMSLYINDHLEKDASSPTHTLSPQDASIMNFYDIINWINNALGTQSKFIDGRVLYFSRKNSSNT